MHLGHAAVAEQLADLVPAPEQAGLRRHSVCRPSLAWVRLRLEPTCCHKTVRRRRRTPADHARADDLAMRPWPLCVLPCLYRNEMTPAQSRTSSASTTASTMRTCRQPELSGCCGCGAAAASAAPTDAGTAAPAARAAPRAWPPDTGRGPADTAAGAADPAGRTPVSRTRGGWTPGWPDAGRDRRGAVHRRLLDLDVVSDAAAWRATAASAAAVGQRAAGSLAIARSTIARTAGGMSAGSGAGRLADVLHRDLERGRRPRTAGGRPGTGRRPRRARRRRTRRWRLPPEACSGEM